MRFWERGVGYTMASGTGSASAVVASIITGRTGRAVRAVCDGGTLEVEWPEGGSVSQTGRGRDPVRRRLADPLGPAPAPTAFPPSLIVQSH